MERTAALPSTPSAATRWGILALLFAARAAIGFEFQTLGSVSGTLAGRHGFSQTEIGTLIGLFMAPGLLLALPAGFAGRYLADRTLVTLGLLTMAAGAVLGAVAGGFGLLALGRLAAGVGFVFSTVYFTKMVADWFAGRELATAMSVLVMSWPFGIAMGQVGHVWIEAAFGWRAVFAAAAIHTAAGAAAVALLYRPPPGAKPQAPGGLVGLLPREWALTLLAAAAWGCFNAGYVLYLSFAPQVLVAGGHGSASAAAIVSVASWVMLGSGALWGHLADRTGRRGLLLHGGLAVGTAALLLLPLTSLSLLWSLLFGLFGTAPAGLIMAMTGEAMAPQRRALGMGVFFSGFFLLVAVAPPLAGRLHDLTGDPVRPLQFAALLFVATSACCVAFRRVQRRAVAVAAVSGA